MFCQRLREARKKAGMSQSDLATKVGVVKATISSYESGNREPDLEKLACILTVLGADANYMLLGETEKAGQQNHSLSPSPAAISIAQKYDRLDRSGKRLLDIIAEIEIQRLEENK